MSIRIDEIKEICATERCIPRACAHCHRYFVDVPVLIRALELAAEHTPLSADHYLEKAVGFFRTITRLWRDTPEDDGDNLIVVRRVP